MKLFLKIVAVVLILILVAGLLLFSHYKAPLENMIAGKLSSILSFKLGHPVEIDSFTINSHSSFTIKQLEIFSADRKKVLLSIDSFTASTAPSAFFQSGNILISKLSAGNIPLGDVLSGYTLKEKQLHFPDITASPFGSKSRARLTIDLRNADIPYTLETEITNTPLSKLSNALSDNNLTIPGSLYVAVSLKGSLMRAMNSTGTCWLSISDSAFERIPEVRRFLDDLYPSQQRIFQVDYRLTSASAQFKISNRKIYTDTLTIEGPGIRINARGAITMNGDLSFDFKSNSTANSFLPPEVKEQIPSSASLSGNLRTPIWSVR